MSDNISIIVVNKADKSTNPYNITRVEGVQLELPEEEVSSPDWMFEYSFTQGVELDRVITSHIWLGNPGDTDYVPTPVVGVYLGTITTWSGIQNVNDYWYCRGHDGIPEVCRIVNGDIRTTDSRTINTGYPGSVTIDPEIIERLDAKLASID